MLMIFLYCIVIAVNRTFNNQPMIWQEVVKADLTTHTLGCTFLQRLIHAKDRQIYIGTNPIHILMSISNFLSLKMIWKKKFSSYRYVYNSLFILPKRLMQWAQLMVFEFTLQVFDYDRYSRNDVVGQVSMRLEDFTVTSNLEVWAEVVKSKAVRMHWSEIVSFKMIEKQIIRFFTSINFHFC